MIFLVFFLVWYFIGLVSLGWVVKFNYSKIKKHFKLYILMGMFGFLVTLLIFLDIYVERMEK
jgi:hypothetical protein